MKTPHRIVLALALVAAQWAAYAQTTVKDPWVRGTVPQQKATGMFAQITSTGGGKLVSATSPAANVVEIHEMAMEGDVMKMRAVTGLDLPAGQAVELKPGGYHVMLMDLKAPLAKGSTVPVTLMFKNAQGAESKLELQVPVQAQMPAMQGGHGSHGMHK